MKKYLYVNKKYYICCVTNGIIKYYTLCDNNKEVVKVFRTNNNLFGRVESANIGSFIESTKKYFKLSKEQQQELIEFDNIKEVK